VATSYATASGLLLFARLARRLAAITPQAMGKSRLKVCAGRLRSGFSNFAAGKRANARVTGVSLQFVSRRAEQCDSKANTVCYFVAAVQLPVNFSFPNHRADSFSPPGVNWRPKV
jgi:chromosome partitioning protein